MAFPNITDLAATTIEHRSPKIADNVSLNNGLWKKMKMKGHTKTFSGGTQILEPIAFAENQNFQFYSGYDVLQVSASDVISAATFGIKQAAVAITVSGLELLQNAGPEKIIDLLSSRINIAETTMANRMAGALYSDGTGWNGKQIAGLPAIGPVNPAVGVYGGIDPAAWPFWQSKTLAAGTQSATTIGNSMNQLWATLVRGGDRSDLIVMDANLWTIYLSSLQANQRFTDTSTGALGFGAIKYMADCDVICDGGIGGFCPANSAWFLNTDYLYMQVHKDRNMVPLNPNHRSAINQDAEVQLIGWAGNATCSNRSLQGFFKGY